MTAHTDTAGLLTVQWYGDEGNAMVFARDGECLAEITGGDRDQVTARLKALGWRPKRWQARDWGSESKLERRADTAGGK